MLRRLLGRWGAGLTPRSLFGLAATVMLSGALLLILLVRLIAAGQTARAIPPYPLVGHPAPDFTVALWNGTPGQKLHLADLRGKPVVVNFWASWCDNCQQEMPALQGAAQQYKGVVFVGLAYGDTPEHGKPFLQKYGVAYPSGPDADGSISVKYGVTGVPETVFIGRDGKIVSHTGGGLDASGIAAGVQSILK
jgi:cytochrome c biogenesis protein CcmG/thiol:disulfide interchange protein DsbE